MDKKFLLNESKVFCMFPWVHLNVTPHGNVYPCCSSDYVSPLGNTKNESLKQIFNSTKLKEIRTNMLTEKESDLCRFCYQHEKNGSSFRQYANEQFQSYFDDIVPYTLEDGSVEHFKMRYMDIRFNNICNFKCRTCGSEFSSQWAAEDKKYNPNIKIFQHATEDDSLLNEALSHIDHLDLIYFGGGEPLLMDEHYVFLEEIIKQNKTDIRLRYNTNASTLKYKSNDVLDLWKHFSDVEVSVSLDHYGDRAEYIRNGTDWGLVESNLHKIRNTTSVKFSINTVLSIFNYVTLNEFYSYMMKSNLFRKDDYYNTLYQLLNPSFYSAQALPTELKLIGKEKNLKLFETLQNLNYSRPEFVKEAINFAESNNTWDSNKESFKFTCKSKDIIRNEDFVKVFPELSMLYD